MGHLRNTQRYFGHLKVGGWGGGPCDYRVNPVPIGLGFGTASGLCLGLRGPDLGLGLDNILKWNNIMRKKGLFFEKIQIYFWHRLFIFINYHKRYPLHISELFCTVMVIQYITVYCSLCTNVITSWFPAKVQFSKRFLKI